MDTHGSPQTYQLANSPVHLQDYFPGKRIRKSYFAALVVTALAGLFVYFSLVSMANNNQRTADMLSLHAEQHDYVQRVTLLLSLLTTQSDVTDREALRAELTEHLNILEANHTFLVHQGNRFKLDAAVYDAYFREDNGLDEAIKEIMAKARELTSMSVDVFSPREPNFLTILHLSPIIRDQYKAIFRIYEHFNTDNVASLNTFAYALLVMLAVMIGGQALLIFMPMESAIRRQHMYLQREIARRATVETALRRSEHAYRLLADNFPNGIVALFDGALRHTVASGQELAKLGIEQTQLVQKTVRDVFKMAQADLLESYYYAALKGESVLFEMETLSQVYEVRVQPVKDDQDNVISGMVMAQNITLRKQVEAALRKNEEQMRMITENVEDLIGLMDTDMRVIYASPSFKKVLGYDPQQLIGMDCVSLMHSDDYLRCMQRRESAVDAHQTADTQDFRYHHADGHYVWLETKTTFLYNDRQLGGAIIVGRDVTERHMMQTLLLEQEILKSELDKEQELSQLKSRMMTRISHEFRTPLSVIMTTADLMGKFYERLSVERRQEMRDGLAVQIQRISQMLDDISLAVNGGFVPKKLVLTPVDVGDLCTTTITQICNTATDTVEVIADVPDGISIPADRHVLQQALYNILDNAVKYSPANTPVMLSVTETDHYLRITVRDHGIGIPPEDLERVFEPFYRGTNLNEVQGLGLGLTIAHAAVTAHRGTLNVTSYPDNGTTVQIDLVLQPENVSLVP